MKTLTRPTPGVVIVVSTEPALIDPPHFPDPRALHGSALLGEVVNILINERLYRDLHDAESVNQRLRQLEQLVNDRQLSPEGAESVRRAFHWRPLQIIQIRPERPLPGTAISAFSDPALRAEYIAQGVARAEAVLRRCA